MSGHKISAKLRATVFKLRSEERLSLDEISARTGVAKGTLSVWLRKHPLTNSEKLARRNSAHSARRHQKLLLESKFYKIAGSPSRERKGKIAEAAVLFRLALNGFNVFSSVFDGDRIDYLVEVPETGRVTRVEVRWARQGKFGNPSVQLLKHSGRENTKHISEDRADYLVGYDLFTDTAFVFDRTEFSSVRATLSMRADAAEAWTKLRG